MAGRTGVAWEMGAAGAMGRREGGRVGWKDVRRQPTHHVHCGPVDEGRVDINLGIEVGGANEADKGDEPLEDAQRVGVHAARGVRRADHVAHLGADSPKAAEEDEEHEP